MTDSGSNHSQSWHTSFSPELILYFSVILGFGIRASAVFSREFPLNDGGLFYSMIQDLLNNHLALPLYTTYNQAGIPFAYPPLGLYVAALLAQAGMPLLQVLRIVPVLISTATIPACYQFANHYLENKIAAAFAAWAVAVLPDAFLWRIMGGGITRSFGFFFFVLTLNSLYSLFRRPTWQRIALTSLLGTATVMSHPEAALQLGLGALLLSGFLLREKRTLFAGALAALIIFLCTALWWLPILQSQGLSILAALARSGTWIPGYLLLLNMIAHLDPVTITCVLIGLIAGRREKAGWLSTYFVAMFICLPRSAPQFGVVNVAILAGIGLELLHAHILTPLDRGPSFSATHGLRMPRPSTLGAICLMLLIFVPNWVQTLTSPVMSALSSSDRAAMYWITQNAEPSARFLILNGTDFIAAKDAEWFPALTGRINAVPVQGYEWLVNVDFGRQVSAYRALQDCRQMDVTCLRTWAEQYHASYDYIYLVKDTEASIVPQPSRYSDLKTSLDSAADFELVYENASAIVYRKIR